MGLLGAKPAWHKAAHHAAFSAGAFCKGAIDFAEVRMRSGVVGREGVEQMVERNAARSSAWPALHLTLTLSGLLDANPT